MKIPGALELPFQEDPSLLQGSSGVTQPLDPEGQQLPYGSNTPHCQHDASFFANPDYEAILAQQEWEANERDIQNALQGAGLEGAAPEGTE